MATDSRRPVIFNPRRREITKHYTNGEVTVEWKPKLCIHTMMCFEGLPTVFDPDRRPWVDPEAATTEEIVAQVKECPSGALSYYMNNGQAEVPAPEIDQEQEEQEPEVSVEILPNGPLLVRGMITIRDASGNEVQKGPVTALCRCGATRRKPFCDGAHSRVGFVG